MIYVKQFKLLKEEQESYVSGSDPRKIYVSYYPLGIFSFKRFYKIEFENITIFYGGNGSGKTTLLNIISQKLNATRKSSIDKGNYFDIYVGYCQYEMTREKPNEIKRITSDDIFDYLLDIRSINKHVNRRKEEIGKDYVDYKYSLNSNAISIEDYEQIKNANEARKKTMSSFIRNRLTNNNIIEQSNGESALMFWEKEITENSVYILDEPENSLSAENQIKLKQFIEESSRFYNCQFIISTHSPFLLGLKDAKIYDLDEIPVKDKKWSELKNVKIYYDFFKENEKDFE
ncbi:MAG: AAA family ATPase [Bacilli bacterium]|nr:AAA family ATPase [Bacilli bacterium]